MRGSKITGTSMQRCALVALDRTDAAIVDLRRALDLDPARVACWEHLAGLLADRTGRLERARLSTPSSRSMVAKQLHPSLGRLLAQSGEIGAAVEHLGRAGSWPKAWRDPAHASHIHSAHTLIVAPL